MRSLELVTFAQTLLTYNISIFFTQNGNSYIEVKDSERDVNNIRPINSYAGNSKFIT